MVVCTSGKSSSSTAARAADPAATDEARLGRRSPSTRRLSPLHVKEINEQADTVRDTLNACSRDFAADLPFVFSGAQGLAIWPRPSASRSWPRPPWHAALVQKVLAREARGVPVDVDLASEFRYRRPSFARPGRDGHLAVGRNAADTLAVLLDRQGPGLPTLGSRTSRAARSRARLTRSSTPAPARDGCSLRRKLSPDSSSCSS